MPNIPEQKSGCLKLALGERKTCLQVALMMGSPVTLDKSNRTAHDGIRDSYVHTARLRSAGLKGGIYMQRTISAMVGKGSVNHNSRKFKAENVDGERSCLNIDYCNEDIKCVYHQLFDEALERYNAKQTRNDRKIDNYYEKIRTSKQEKPFHELILQIGDRDNMSAESENGELAKQILDEYFQGFQERNPYLKVFSAHLHMDEATPHLHIDFVPFTTGSKRGLDTRVSLKQALSAQGFKGGSRGDTEWSQWVQSEKEQLAEVMERHGVQWEQKGTHEKHLSVLEFEKRERAKEVAALTEKKEKLQVENQLLGEEQEELQSENQQLESEQKELRSENQNLVIEQKELQSENQQLEVEQKELQESLEQMAASKTVLERNVHADAILFIDYEDRRYFRDFRLPKCLLYITI